MTRWKELDATDRKLAAVAAIAGVAVLAPMLTFDSDTYQDFAIGIQSAAVVVGLVYAGLTLQNERVASEEERRAKRVDRVLALHEPLVAGDVRDARRRLADLIRSRRDPAGHVIRVTPEDLAGLTYGPTSDASPKDDLVTMLRYFQGIDGARSSGGLDEDLLLRVVGGHAAWLDEALVVTPTERKPERVLRDLARWANDLAAIQQVPDWGRSRREDFGRLRSDP